MAEWCINLPIAITILVVGFVLLIKGADFFVEGASSAAKMLKVPTLIIGMTIVAMGTSLPETSVSVTASIQNANELAISNAVGSNIFNLMVVLGVCAVIIKLPVSKETLKRDYPFSIICAAVVLAIGGIGMCLSHFDGFLLLLLFVVFMVVMIRSALAARKAGMDVEIEGEEDIHEMSVWKLIIFIIGGLIAIKFGGDFVVNSATYLAQRAGMSQTIIGLTVVALGTSLPELATSIAAARKNELDMAIGNVVGSNIFNLLMVVGIAAAISPMTFIMDNIEDLIILIVFSLITFALCFKKEHLNRRDGIIMLLLYVGYIIFTILRELYL